MSDVWTILRLFPENGLDRSLHVPVFLGLILLSFFRETLGWSFAGLVVPGYLATVLVAAPVSGAIVVGEAIVAYLLALALGRLLPRAGFGFTFFGRERFLLVIACCSLVRLAVEASLLPMLVARWDLAHSRELYSLGLVLVPLLANGFWNAGFVRTFPRVAFVTGLTYLLVADVLLPYTNFTLSRFQVANENVSLAFLESPHAHIVLLTGALIAARNNVRYGWDYNGILVPALLALAWYEPTKVATTVGESVLVYFLSRALVNMPPLSRMMIVGSRRVLLTFTVGFFLKYALGAALFRWFPHVELLDFFGFGYLLPSLLANKMWARGTIAGILMPTLQVSLLAFPLGTLLGFGLRSFEAHDTIAMSVDAPVTVSPSVPLTLMLGDLAPAPDRSGSESRFIDAYQVAESLLLAPFGLAQLPQSAQQLANRSGLRTERDEAGHWTILTPQGTDANADPAGPRVAVRTAERYGDRWLLLVDAPTTASPTIPLAFALATRIGARAIVLRSRFASIARRDEDLGLDLARSLQLDRILRVSLSEDTDTVSLHALGALPRELSTALVSEVLHLPVQLKFRSLGTEDSLLNEAVLLRLNRSQAEQAASRLLQSPDLEQWNLHTYRQWEEILNNLSRSDPRHFTIPSTRQLRLYRYLLQLSGTHSGPPGVWQRALAKQLGMRFAQTKGLWEGWVLYEPSGPQRRGMPTVLRRINGSEPSGLSVILAAPRWQRGGIATALRMAQAFDAEQLLVHGTLVNLADNGSADPRQPNGRRLWFQGAHESWLDTGGQAIILRALPRDRARDYSIVANFDSNVAPLQSGPAWFQPLIRTLSGAGLSIAAVDGTAERAGLTASTDPAVAYARRFAPDRAVVLWLAPDLRNRWRRAGTRATAQDQLAHSQLTLANGSPSDLLRTLRACRSASSTSLECSLLTANKACDQDLASRMWERYNATANPFFLRDALIRAHQCGWAAARDPVSETVWLIRPPVANGPAGNANVFLAQPLVGLDMNARTEPFSVIELSQFDTISQFALTPLAVRVQ